MVEQTAETFLEMSVHQNVIAIFFYFALLTAPPLSAQDATALQAQADELSNHSRWPEAAEKYSAAVKVDPSNGYAWYSLGECLLQMKKFDDAAQAENNAIKHNFRPLLAQVSLARIAAAKGDRDQALNILERIASNPNASAIRPA